MCKTRKLWFTLLCFALAFVLPACDDEDKNLHEMRIVENSTNLGSMEQIAGLITELTNFWSEQWEYVDMTDEYVIGQFDNFCLHLKQQIESYARDENYSILPDTYVVVDLYRLGDGQARELLKTSRIDFSPYTAEAPSDGTAVAASR